MERLRYDDTELDCDSLKRAKDELNETDENKKICLEKLKKKLLDKEGLNPCLKDAFLLSYLRVTKYDCAKAYQRVIRLYEERNNVPSVFGDYSPSTIKKVETARQLYTAPYRNKDNSAIIILTRSDYDTSKVHYDLIIRALCMTGDMVILHPLNQIFGYTFILDLSSSSWSGWSEYTPSRIKLLARLLQKTLPLKIRYVHIINAPSIYYLLYSIASPFLSAKIRNRIIIHKNNESLQQYVDPVNLPEEYGGTLDRSDLINLFERLYKMEDFFETYSKYGYKNKS